LSREGRRKSTFILPVSRVAFLTVGILINQKGRGTSALLERLFLPLGRVPGPVENAKEGGEVMISNLHLAFPLDQRDFRYLSYDEVV